MKSLIIVVVVVVVVGYVNCDGELTEEQKNYATSVQNTVRAGKGANNMYKLIWDADLEKEMKALVDKCLWEHTADDVRSWGENLAQLRFPTPAYLKSFGWKQKIDILVTKGMSGFDSWVTEDKYDVYKNFSCAFRLENGKTCGHYTQVVWAASSKMGCAAKNCLDFTQNKSPEKITHNVWILACAYRVPGNMAGEKAFETGKACSACKSGDKCEDKLCVAS